MESQLRILRALSGSTRLRLIRLLLAEEICVCELEHILQISQPAISQQLRILRDAGLLTARREGNWIFYQVEGPVLLRAWESVRETLFSPLGSDPDTEGDRARLQEVLAEPFRNCPDRISKEEAPTETRIPIDLHFVCTGNSCRSQMAEYFARAFADPARLRVASSGVSPSRVHPLTIEVMGELGIDLTGAVSESTDPERLREADLIVTLCGDARDRCPTTPPSVKRRHWGVRDAAAVEGDEEEKLAAFREVRNDIARRVRDLLGELDALVRSGPSD
ncbi:MAG: metalloregulator ArsR/SmtB family transcription factor [Bacillota bacterium]